MKHIPIHDMVRQAADRFGDHIAIEWEDREVTYQQLEERSNEIALALVEAGVRKGSQVAILAGMTADVVASILGVLKAGAVFIPFDPEFPAVHLESALGEVQPEFWLADPTYLPSLERRQQTEGLEGKMLLLAQDWLSREGWRGSTELPTVELEPDAHCYIYFTSGSSGRPKAIAGRLKAIDHFIRWQTETFDVTEHSRVCQVTSPAFDGFLHEAFSPLIVGGTLCVSSYRETLLDGARLAAWLESQRVNLIHCTPSLFRSILSQELTPERFPDLEYVLLAGEAILPADVRKWYDKLDGRIPLVNLYGPTETTLTKFFYIVRPEDAHLRAIPIGEPMPGTKALVVDDKGRPCPPGKLGEIYIRTPYCSLGYLNQPQLSSEVFIQNPFSDKEGDIVYKTGDLGRVREDGLFEFVGRRDHQVKVRGVRIELAAIENLLLAHPEVAEVAVVDRLDTQGNKFLCAYLVLNGDLEASDLRDHLLERMPESMVPSAFVMLEDLPRTLNGKVDRRALPDPGQASSSMGAEYVAPSTPIEEKLCGMFAELLNIPKVGVKDNFFERGGHSLLVMQLLAKIRSEYVPVPLGQVFQTPTPESLAVKIASLMPEQTEEEEIAQLVDQIADLSDETVEEMIKQEREETPAPANTGI